MSNTHVIRRHSRVLRLLSHLQSGTGLNAAELASQMDVCRRTVYRDLSLMRDAGLDVYFDNDSDCYRLSSECDVVVLPSFSADDLAILIAAVHLSVLTDLPSINKSLRQSTSKLLSRSPRPVRHSVSRLVSSFAVQTPFSDYPSQAIQVLHVIFQAIQRRQTVQVTFSETAGEESPQTIFSPYRVVVSSEKWQVIGLSTCHCGDYFLDPRDVQKAELTKEIYAIPEQFTPQFLNGCSS